jgi:hypothetical protein
MATFQLMALLPTVFHSKDSITTKIYVVVAVVLLQLLMVSPNVSDNGVLT